MRWRGKVVTYPAGVLAGPDNIMHPAPIPMWFERVTTVRWEQQGGQWTALEIDFDARTVEAIASVDVDVWPSDTPRREAWDEAREEAQGNHRI